MKNGCFVFDAHCHIYPAAIAAKAAAAIGTFYEHHSSCTGRAEEIIEINKEAGIDMSLVQSAATVPHQVESINEFIAATVKKYPESFIGFGTLHPDSENTEKEIEHLLSLGLQGVKIHNDFIRVAVDDARMDKIYRLCAESHLPLLLHTGDKRYDFTNPNRMEKVLSANPDLTVIGAHFGGWSVWEEASTRLARFDNLVVDCSSSTAYITPELGRELVHRYGAERVMFGSDFPFNHPSDELERTLALGLTDEEYRLILGENAKRLLRIQK
ncbi:MAG: amidohydrolase [Clostridia bacterium]|nr:amidohydrolase [Clostridia bacterium]